MRSVARIDEIARFRQNPFSLQGLGLLIRGLGLYTHPDTTPPEQRMDRMVRNASLAAGYSIGLGQKSTKLLSGDDLPLSVLAEEAPENLLALAGFALRGVAAYRATVAESASFRAWAATAPNAGLLGEIGAAEERARKVALFNPTNGTQNCVQCVTALVEAVQNEGLVRYAHELPQLANEGRIGRVLSFITKETGGAKFGVTFGRPQYGTTIGTGDYVVFTRLSKEGVPGHVMFARTMDDLTWFYDPQIGTGAPFLDEPFIAYPINYLP